MATLILERLPPSSEIPVKEPAAMQKGSVSHNKNGKAVGTRARHDDAEFGLVELVRALARSTVAEEIASLRARRDPRAKPQALGSREDHSRLEKH